MVKTTIKKKKEFKYSGNESQMLDLDQKRELKKCNETLKLLANMQRLAMLCRG